MTYSTRPSVPLLGIFGDRLRGKKTEDIHAHDRAMIARANAQAEHNSAKNRLRIAMVLSTAVYVAIGLKMAALAMSAPIENINTYTPVKINGDRADIVDRNGEILATNLPGYSLYVQPHEMVDPKAAAQKLSQIFPDMSEEKLYEWFTREGSKFRWLKDQISPEQKQAVFNLGEPGLQFGKRELRLYPNGPIASHILGGVSFGEKGVNAAEIKGQAGIEFASNDFLSNPKNAHRELKLSIDVAVQDALENVLYKGMKANFAKGASAVLMESDTGRIIAMTSLPDFDPNLRPKGVIQGNDPSLDSRFDKAALGTYELGSTFKVFTAAQALENGVANPSTMLKAGRSVQQNGYTIKDFHFYGEQLSLTDIIVKSSNVGTARLARAMGPEVQKKFLGELGFLEPTSLELAEARRGQPLYPQRWTNLSAMTISYGHGLAATPLHLATGYATMVNGGFKVNPTLFQDIPDDLTRSRIISAKTSMQIRDMLRQVVTRGTASFAKTKGYDIGGKTGTAEKLNPNGGYYVNKNINTFASAFPMSDPKYVLVVVLDEPNTPDPKKRTAGWTVVPVAKDIVERVAPLLNIRPVYTPDLPMVAKVMNDG